MSYEHISKPLAELMDEWGANIQQPAPTVEGEPVTEHLIQLIRERSEAGAKKYGTVLRAHNGRDALIDALQESLDMNQYLMQVVLELRAQIDGRGK